MICIISDQLSRKTIQCSIIFCRFWFSKNLKHPIYRVNNIIVGILKVKVFKYKCLGLKFEIGAGKAVEEYMFYNSCWTGMYEGRGRFIIWDYIDYRNEIRLNRKKIGVKWFVSCRVVTVLYQFTIIITIIIITHHPGTFSGSSHLNDTSLYTEPAEQLPYCGMTPFRQM